MCKISTYQFLSLMIATLRPQVAAEQARRRAQEAERRRLAAEAERRRREEAERRRLAEEKRRREAAERKRKVGSEVDIEKFRIILA
jgi:hypothetical protein